MSTQYRANKNQDKRMQKKKNYSWFSTQKKQQSKRRNEA